MSVKHLPCGSFANHSERHATEYLKARLQNFAATYDWVLLTNYASSSGSQYLSDELDLIVVGPPGVSIIEIKYWNTADIKGNRQDIAAGEAEKLNDKAKKLKGKLSRACSFDVGFVEGKLLLTKGENEKFLEGLVRKRIRGIDLFGLTEWKDLLEVQRQPVLANEQITAISRVLQPEVYDASQGKLRVFDSFFDLGPIPGAYDDFHRAYHARRKPSRDKVLLHIYDLTASQEKNPLDIARREFDILQRLQKSPWLPSLMDSFQEAKNYPGELYFFSYVNTEAPSLLERAKDPEWCLQSRIYTALRCFEALQDLHQQGLGESETDTPILHRNLTPSSIHVRSNNEPLLTQLHLAKLPGAQTVASAASSNFAGFEGFVAPEVLASGISASTVASDVYALCSSLRSIFVDVTDASQQLLTEDILTILDAGMNSAPPQRSGLEDLFNDFMQLVSPPPEPALERVAVQYWDEDTVVKFKDRYYRIITRLGSGGFGTTFKVMEVDPDTGDELSGPYVAKAITNGEAGAEAAKAYAKVRAQTGTPHLAGVLEVASNWQPNEITALLKWIKGEPLNEWAGALPLYFDELGSGTRDELSLEWIRDLCEGLAQLHQVGLIHGDVSPRNIIVDGSNVTLTDFDTAGAAASVPLGATTHYCAPDVEAGISVNATDDIFALGATMFHVLFDNHPFQYDIGLNKARGLNWHGIDRSEWKRVAAFLDRATHPDKTKRFASAMDALLFLDSASEQELATQSSFVPAEALQVRTDNVVPWLSQLLQSYPGSPKGNAETRGLDSAFAKQTYVETKLDTILADDIKNRRISIVVLCGNAGDGKTAFLQNLAAKLGLEVGASAQRIWKATLPDGLKIYANLDGSASYQERSANELLNEFFAPFQDANFPENLVHLLAINDGPLLAWLNESAETYLTEQLYAALSEDAFDQLNSRIRFIDLNVRSLVGGFLPDSQHISTNFIEQILSKMLGEGEDIWTPCHTCTAQPRCHAWTSVDALRDPQRGLVLRDRLTRALQGVHQRGEIHITARSLRATLVYIFFGTDECSDLHSDPNLPHAHYFDRAFDPRSEFRQGELLNELQWLDPALESHPYIDRFLLRKWVNPFNLDAPGVQPSDLRSLRRRAYFEWTDDEIRTIGGTTDALGLARGHHLETFLRVATGTETERQSICSQLCEGIARLEDLPDEAFDDQKSVPLKITPRTPTETAFWVNKPRERFSLRPRQVRAINGIETLHTHVILSYLFNTGHTEELMIGAELFNSLMELREGYQISDAQSDDVFANLSIFKQRLAQEGDRVLFAWNPAGEGVMKLEASMIDGVQKLTVAAVSQEVMG